MSEKSEKATPRKLSDARKRGQVTKTEEAASYGQVSVVFLFFIWKGSQISAQIQAFIVRCIELCRDPSGSVISSLISKFLILIATITLPLAAALIIITILINLVQTGPLIATEALKLSLEKLNPGKNIKNILSLDKLFEVAKSLAILSMLGLLFVAILHSNLRSLQILSACGVSCGAILMTHLLNDIFLTLIIFGIFLSILDFSYKKYKMVEDLKMTKEEVKQEFKNEEGNPEIKARRRAIHHELLSGNLADMVQRSTAVVRNPTHIAICLYYHPGETPLPIVLTKGADSLAQRIVEIAIISGVPVVHDITLARALNKVHEGHRIPLELFLPVAAVLAALKKLEGGSQRTSSDG
ncbi:EscU/YscU/HrcU family type III secretion system export apparatus switch protein [Paraburkholderia sediminicola]|uniref:EscU/YscU/HrcU family type III secretion system export apparatus switch protein n=1 Tax=Paraburkholderia sediminicola TaxID=458836 RepID=UPI0038BA2611